MAISVKLEPAELSMVLKAVEIVIEQQRCPFCENSWQPILEHLRNPEPVVAPTETVPLQQFGPQPRTIEEAFEELPKRPVRAKIKRQPPLNPKRWTPEEDAVIHKFNTGGSPIWGSMVLGLPSRTVDSIKARYFRLGLDKIIEPPEAVPTRTEIEQELVELGVVLPATPEPVATTPEPPPEASPPPPPPPREPPQVATPTSTKDWSWTQVGPSKEKLMGGR